MFFSPTFSIHIFFLDCILCGLQITTAVSSNHTFVSCGAKNRSDENNPTTPLTFAFPSKRITLKIHFLWDQCLSPGHPGLYMLDAWLSQTTSGNTCTKTQIACHHSDHFTFESEVQIEKAIASEYYIMHF